MINNILRIFLSRTLFHATMKERAMIENEIKEKKNEISEEKIEAICKYKQDREKFCVRPIMAETYEINMLMAYKISIKLVIAFTLGAIGAIVYLSFFDTTVYYADAMGNLESTNNILVIIALVVVMWFLPGLFKLGHKYMEKTKYVFFQNKISIRRLGMKEKTITYDELGSCIENKKVRVHNGRFEFLYIGGKIPVYTWGDELMPLDFYQFLNEKCGINIPDIQKEDNEVVRKTGIGRIFYSYFGIPLICSGIIFGFIGSISEFGINWGMDFWRYYVSYLLSPINGFGLLGVGCLVIGFVLKLYYYFPAKKHFAKYKDIIKVTLF